MGSLAGLKLSVSPCERSSLYNLLAYGEHSSVLHMKNETQTWPKLGVLDHSAGFLLFSLQMFSWSQVFFVSKAYLWTLSANKLALGYFTRSNMFYLFLKECENTPVRVKSNNQG